MNFDIEEIKIKFSTNIQNKEYKIVEFTRSMLSHPELSNISLTLNDYPYFTFDVKYPLSKLRYLTYKERIEFFFNRENFSNRLSTYAKGRNILDKSKLIYEEGDDKNSKMMDDSPEKEYYKQRDRHIQTNIMAMLELLFPTKFPVINDIQTSYNIVFDKVSMAFIPLDPTLVNHYSYLKLGGETYTFKKLIWINDILNHPVYQRLILEYRKFWTWSNEEKLKQLKITKRNYSSVKKRVDDFFEEIESKYKGDKPIYIFTKTLEYVLPKIIELKYLMGSDLNNMKHSVQYFKHVSQTTQNKIINSINKINTDYDNYIDKYKQFAYIYDSMEKYIKNVTNKEEKDASDKLMNMGVLYKSDSVKQFVEAVKRYSFIESLFLKTYNEISNKKDVTIPPEYRNFAYSILNEYKKPLRESSNIELQELINGVDNQNVQKFYKFIKQIYHKYVLGKRIRISEEYINLMNVGLSYINTNVAQGQRREIYVYTDFISGVVNNDNANNIFCPYVGDHLGNEFDFLAKGVAYGKTGSKDTQKWNINRNRMIFSIKDAKSKESTESTTDVKGDVKANNVNIQYTKKDQNFETRIKEDTLNSIFISEIATKDNIRELIGKVNNYPGNPQPITEQGLLKFLLNNKDAGDLYKYIEEWNGDVMRRNQKLLEKLVQLKAKYNGIINANNTKKNTQEYISDLNKMAALNHTNDILNLFLAITQRLIDIEEKKVEGMGGPMQPKGGKRMKKSRKYKKRLFNKFTRKMLRKII